jgi:hypothetical protein
VRVHGKSWYQCLVCVSLFHSVLSLRNQNYPWIVSECVSMSALSLAWALSVLDQLPGVDLLDRLRVKFLKVDGGSERLWQCGGGTCEDGRGYKWNNSEDTTHCGLYCQKTGSIRVT